jgi:catechol 2,3-dioxygenase-like lactoylglutathione lyase family enzyme
MSELEIDAIGQIHITVTDIDAAVAFYGDILGMKLLFRVPEQSMAFFDCGGIRLYLGPAEGLDHPSRPLVYYRVDAVERACAAVEQRGADLEARPHVVHRTDRMELWVASLRDPEGNLVCLMEERQLAAGGDPT